MKRWRVAAAACAVAVLVITGMGLRARADTTPAGTFNLQVTPSPLVATIKPGARTTLQLKIRNAGTMTENLAITARAFKYDSVTGKIELQANTSPPVASWITYANPKFTVQPGQWFTEDIGVDIPPTAGFSYSFALEISRQKVLDAPLAGSAISGSVAVFTLINVDRAGATSKLGVASFTADKKLYEYPPVNLTVRFKNSGNTILQPSGNIFIQRNAGSKKSMAALVVNAKNSYILPGTERNVIATWNSGFATYQPNNSGKGRHLLVNWQKFAQFRIGRYSARLVAVYDDDERDVPIQGTVTFWIIPWRAILTGIILLAALVWVIRWRGKKRTEKAVKKALAAHAAAQKAQKRPVEEKTDA